MKLGETPKVAIAAILLALLALILHLVLVSTRGRIIEIFAQNLLVRLPLHCM